MLMTKCDHIAMMLLKDLTRGQNLQRNSGLPLWPAGESEALRLRVSICSKVLAGQKDSGSWNSNVGYSYHLGREGCGSGGSLLAVRKIENWIR